MIWQLFLCDKNAISFYNGMQPCMIILHNQVFKEEIALNVVVVKNYGVNRILFLTSSRIAKKVSEKNWLNFFVVSPKGLWKRCQV